MWPKLPAMARDVLALVGIQPELARLTMGSGNRGRGSLIIHEIIQQPDGSLTIKLPQEVESQFKQKVPISLVAQKYEW